MPGAGPSVDWDLDGDGQVTISNLVVSPWYGPDRGAGRVGRAFQAEVRSILALGVDDEDLSELPAVQVPASLR